MQTRIIDNKHEARNDHDNGGKLIRRASEQNTRTVRVHYVASFVAKMPLMAVDRRPASRSLSGSPSLITGVSARCEIERASRFFFSFSHRCCSRSFHGSRIRSVAWVARLSGIIRCMSLT